MERAATRNPVGASGPVGFSLFAGFFGALVYFLSNAEGFWQILLAVLKSIIWPAYAVYYSLQALGAG